MNKEQKEALGNIIGYYWDMEEKHYEECEDDGIKQDSHIFHSLVTLKEYFDEIK